METELGKMCATMWNTRDSIFFVSMCANVDNKV